MSSSLKSGLNYLVQFSKIKKFERIGDLEAINFQVIGDGRQMGDLLIDCLCHRCNERTKEKPYQAIGSQLNWKISKFQKGALSNLDCGCSQKTPNNQT